MSGSLPKPKLRLLSTSKAFGGFNKRYEYDSDCCSCPMKLTIFFPPKADERAVPVIYYLASMTTTDQTFIEQAGAQRKAAELGVALVCSDNSPRNLPGIAIEKLFPYKNFGYSNSWYLDATSPELRHFQMASWIAKELPEVLREYFPRQLDTRTASIMGFSMGGHGALTLALKGHFRCVSALAPVCSPASSLLGTTYFAQALGPDPQTWKRYDALSLLADYQGPAMEILLDVGSLDEYGNGGVVNPEAFTAAAADHPGVNVTCRKQDGYSHDFHFVQTVIDDHLEWHAKRLKQTGAGATAS